MWMWLQAYWTQVLIAIENTVSSDYEIFLFAGVLILYRAIKGLVWFFFTCMSREAWPVYACTDARYMGYMFSKIGVVCSLCSFDKESDEGKAGKSHKINSHLLNRRRARYISVSWYVDVSNLLEPPFPWDISVIKSPRQWFHRLVLRLTKWSYVLLSASA